MNIEQYTELFNQYINISKKHENIVVKFGICGKYIVYYAETTRDIYPDDELYRCYHKDWLLFFWEKMKNYKERELYFDFIVDICIKLHIYLHSLTCDCTDYGQHIFGIIVSLYLQLKNNHIDVFWNAINKYND